MFKIVLIATILLYIVIMLFLEIPQVTFPSSKLLPDFCAFIYIITLHLKCRGTQDSYSSGDHTPGSKPTYQNQKDAERAQLLDALRHSQTRAREAEVAANNAHDQKNKIIINTWASLRGMTRDHLGVHVSIHAVGFSLNLIFKNQCNYSIEI